MFEWRLVWARQRVVAAHRSLAAEAHLLGALSRALACWAQRAVEARRLALRASRAHARASLINLVTTIRSWHAAAMEGGRRAWAAERADSCRAFAQLSGAWRRWGRRAAHRVPEANSRALRARAALRSWERRAARRATRTDAASRAVAAFAARQRHTVALLRRGWGAWRTWSAAVHFVHDAPREPWEMEYEDSEDEDEAVGVEMGVAEALQDHVAGGGVRGGSRADGQAPLYEPAAADGLGAPAPAQTAERRRMWEELQRLRSLLDVEQRERRSATFLERLHLQQLRQQIELLGRKLSSNHAGGGGGGGGGGRGGGGDAAPLGVATGGPVGGARPAPAAGDHEQRLYSWHLRLENERARHAGLATELRYFARAMELEAPPDDVGGDTYSPARWVPPRARKVHVRSPVRVPLGGPTGFAARLNRGI